MAHYIAVGPFCWGSGQSPNQAISNCRRELPTFVRKGTIVVYETEDVEAQVDEVGNLVAARGSRPTVVKRVEVKQ